MARKKAAEPKSEKQPRSVVRADSRGARVEQSGVFDSLLFVSLGFLLTGIAFLILELMQYQFRLTSG